MSTTMMNRIWWRTDLPMTEKFVAVALADRADDEGVCWPAIETIALKCNCAPRTVQNAVASLCAKGFLRKLERQNNSSYYIFNLDILPVMEQPKRKKERHPLAETMTGESHDIDLFSTGEFHAMTGESHAMTGESPSPKTLRETLEDTSSSNSGDFKSPCVSLVEYVESEWHRLKSDFPGVAGSRKVDDNLAKQIELRARQHAKDGEDPQAVWGAVFTEIRGSLFLTGRVPPGVGRDSPFKLSLGWLCKTMNFREVINGKYSSERGNNRRSFDPSTGQRLGPTAQAVAGTIERMRSAGQRR